MRILLNLSHRFIRLAYLDRAARLYAEAALTLAEAHVTVKQKGNR
jgi:hypothetical protein